MKLTQRIADVAYRWSFVKTQELIKYKKSREVYEQIELDILENHIQFSTLYYCNIKYLNPDHLEFVFGYQVKDKPEYFKKILYEVVFHEKDYNPEVIKSGIDKLVDNIVICVYCDNGNLGVPEYGYLCNHCYIYGTSYEEDSCAICLTKDFGVWLVTPCDHKFHYTCYNKMNEKFCPMCRTYTGNNTSILDY